MFSAIIYLPYVSRNKSFSNHLILPMHLDNIHDYGSLCMGPRKRVLNNYSPVTYHAICLIWFYSLLSMKVSGQIYYQACLPLSHTSNI